MSQFWLTKSDSCRRKNTFFFSVSFCCIIPEMWFSEEEKKITLCLKVYQWKWVNGCLYGHCYSMLMLALSELFSTGIWPYSRLLMFQVSKFRDEVVFISLFWSHVEVLMCNVLSQHVCGNRLVFSNHVPGEHTSSSHFGCLPYLTLSF